MNTIAYKLSAIPHTQWVCECVHACIHAYECSWDSTQGLVHAKQDHWSTHLPSTQHFSTQ